MADKAEELIGKWAMRVGGWSQGPNGKAHRIESVIADTVVTNCGRRMKYRSVTRGTFMPLPPQSDMRIGCYQCRP